MSQFILDLILINVRQDIELYLNVAQTSRKNYKYINNEIFPNLEYNKNIIKDSSCIKCDEIIETYDKPMTNLCRICFKKNNKILSMTESIKKYSINNDDIKNIGFMKRGAHTFLIKRYIVEYLLIKYGPAKLYAKFSKRKIDWQK